MLLVSMLLKIALNERKPTVFRLEDIPNIGKSIAADLRGIGIDDPQQLLQHEPLALYLKLTGPMGKRLIPACSILLWSRGTICNAGKN